MLNTQKIKKDFPIFESNKDLVYLDSAASSQTPQVVIDTITEYYTNYKSNIHRGLYDLSKTATERYENSRNTVAQFLGANSDEIIFTSGATLSVNMLAYSLEQFLGLKSGDEIITTEMEHHSNLIPFQELVKRSGATLKHIPITDSYNLDYDKAEKLITNKTKIVVMTMGSNVLGTINDIKKISKLAHSVGAILVVDASKTVGHMKVNVKDLDCDFLFFSGHKMCGPTGIGVLYGKNELLRKIKPSIFGGGAVVETTGHNTEFKKPPYSFEAGTPNISGAIALGEAVEYIEDIGIENIHSHISEVLKYGIEKLSMIEGLKLFCNTDPSSNIGIMSFTLDGVHSHDIVEIASNNNIALRAGHHCAEPLLLAVGENNLTRASIYIYNNKEDIDALVSTIKKTKDLFAK